MLIFPIDQTNITLIFTLRLANDNLKKRLLKLTNSSDTNGCRTILLFQEDYLGMGLVNDF